mgnify:CR=1 FL=1
MQYWLEGAQMEIISNDLVRYFENNNFVSFAKISAELYTRYEETLADEIMEMVKNKIIKKINKNVT